ncbi:MAG: SGNH/GDSL hydrolase family protein [Spirochaetota bacterium]
MNKYLLVALIILAAIIIFLVAAYAYIYNDAQRLPLNNPTYYVDHRNPDDTRKVVVCAGDSITHGSVSVNYVDMLQKRLGDKYIFVNAGINGELAWNLDQRVNQVIACNPDYVTILIGTNDANASMNEKSSKRYIKDMGLPRKPDKQWYRDNLEKLVDKLKKETDARIALLSLPPIGEEPGNDAYERATEYSREVKTVARAIGVTYLPLHEKMTARIVTTAPRVSYNGTTEPAMYKALARHYLLGKSFDEIAEINGLIYLTDLLHLNSRGAGEVADLIEGFLGQ